MKIILIINKVEANHIRNNTSCEMDSCETIQDIIQKVRKKIQKVKGR